MKSEMPAFVQEVEDAGKALMEAASALKADGESETGKAKLLTGARGEWKYVHFRCLVVLLWKFFVSPIGMVDYSLV